MKRSVSMTCRLAFLTISALIWHRSIAAPPAPTPAPASGAPSALPGLGDSPPVSAPPPSPKVAADYDAIFGKEDREVTATPSTRDDAAFAAKLFQKARELSDEPALVQYVYQKAYEFGSKDPSGTGTAIAAVQSLITIDPQTASDWRPRLIELCQAQLKRTSGETHIQVAKLIEVETLADGDALAARHEYAPALVKYKTARDAAREARDPAAEEIDARIKDVQASLQILDRIQKITAKLTSNPSDQSLLRQVVDLNIIELDDPAAAAKFAQSSSDPKIKAMVPLAASDPKDLPEPDLLELGDWYKSLTTRASRPGIPIVLGRAQTYYQHYLDAHATKDATRMRATQALAEVTKAFDAAGPATGQARIVVWNAHHSTINNCGAAEINVAAFSGGKMIYRRDNIQIPWIPNSDTQVSLSLPRGDVDKVRVEVNQYHGVGGALAEVQVLKGSRNIALGCKVTSSDSYNGDPAYGPATLTDGETSSAVAHKGYWLMATGKPGWAEVDLRAAQKPDATAQP